MFRCRRCGSGYHNRAVLNWASCPRCLAKDRVSSPLEFELGLRPRNKTEASRELPGRSAAVDRGKVLRAMRARQRLGARQSSANPKDSSARATRLRSRWSGA